MRTQRSLSDYAVSLYKGEKYLTTIAISAESKAEAKSIVLRHYHVKNGIRAIAIKQEYK